MIFQLKIQDNNKIEMINTELIREKPFKIIYTKKRQVLAFPRFDMPDLMMTNALLIKKHCDYL